LLGTIGVGTVSNVNMTSLSSYDVDASTTSIGSGNGSTSATLSTSATQAKLVVNNGTADHGLTVGTASTVLSGGTTTTILTLDDSGASLADSAGAPVKLMGVADGTTANDAVNYSQLNTAQTTLQSNINTNTGSINTNAGNIAGNATAIGNLQSGLGTLNTNFSNYQQVMAGELRDIRETAYSGIASAIALSMAQAPSAPGKTAVSFGMGHYEGENAFGVNVSHAIKGFASHRGTVSFGVASSKGNTAGRISAGFEF